MYLYDKENSTLSQIIEYPSATETESGGWKVHSHWHEYSFGKNEDRSLWCKRRGIFPIETYLSRDSKEQALKYFRMNHSPKGIKISYEQFKSMLDKLPEPDLVD